MAVDASDLEAKDIGRDLQPQIARGATVGGEHAGDLQAALAEHLDMVAEADATPSSAARQTSARP
jgi:hypothetical protein